MMKTIFVILILTIICGELGMHFFARPELQNLCMEQDSMLNETKSEVCTCLTDKALSEKYLLFKDGILGNKDKAVKTVSLYHEQCMVLKQDDKAKEKIEKSLKKNISNNLSSRLTSTDQQLLEDLYLNEYTINVRPDKKYRYSVDVEVTAKVRVFFGVVEYQTYLGTLYYDGQAEFDANLSEWKRSKKQVDPSGLINGIEKAHQFFNNN